MIESPGKDATKEENLYSVAVTEAKLRCLQESTLNFLEGEKETKTSVMELMKEVYPAIEPQIGELREVMKEVEADILKDPREKMSLNDVLNVGISRKGLYTALIIGTMVVAACGYTPKTETPATTTPVAEVTEAPTATEAPTPTEVAPDMQKAIAEFNLNTERAYSVSADGYLVDAFNKAKMAKWDKETSEWVDTSLEEKYGHLAPEEPRESYITGEISGKDPLANRNGEYVSFIFSPIWTGNVIDVPIEFEGKTIKVVALEVVFRSQGTLYKKLLSFDSSDLGNKSVIIWFDPKVFNKEGLRIGDPHEILKEFSPGQQIHEEFPVKRPVNEKIPNVDICGYKGSFCIDTYRMNVSIYESEKEELQKFEEELINGSPIETPEDLLLPCLYYGDLRFVIDSNTWEHGYDK